MAELMKPNSNRRSTSHGVGRDGNKRARVPVEQGMHGPMLARAEEVTAHPDIGGKAARHKQHDVVGIAHGMTARQRGMSAMGQATAGAPLDDAKLDLNPTVAHAKHNPVGTKAGMRSRVGPIAASLPHNR